MDNRLVKDYLGNLIPKKNARKIHDKYYVEGESCFLMEDGQWYRKTSSDKIILDHYQKKYVLVGGSKLIKGIVNEEGEEGYFSDNDLWITCKKGRQGASICVLNEKIASKLGFEESICDGIFYDMKFISDRDKLEWFYTKNIPPNERSKSYNLESDQDRKKELEKAYADLNIKISPMSKIISKFIGDMTFGAEFEVINGFLPRRIRNKFGIKALKDGSLRSDKGEGIELVTMPMGGAKGVEVIRQVCNELTKRCEVNNYCSVHFHFGNVRKDKLYTLSIYRLGQLLQNELSSFFPYSRFNSIKEDGKVYCKFLENLDIDYAKLLKQKTESDFHGAVLEEFNKFYKWLNNGKGLAEVHGEPELVRTNVVVDGKKMFYDKWLKTIYSTKSVYHAITGEKWNKPQRYYWINFLNLYFSKIHTIEFRPEPGSTNSTKILIWLITCASIVKFAEDIETCLGAKSITLKQVLEKNVGSKYASYIMSYFEMRNQTFFNKSGSYRPWKTVEPEWFNNDPSFNFKCNGVEIK